jgi:hypothetical protein
VLRWWRRLTGRGVPEGFTGTLSADELVLAVSEVRSGGHLVATSQGLWLPDGRRVGWHLISKATWGGGALTIIEAHVVDTVDGADLLEDQAPQRFALDSPGKIPQVVHQRVTGAILSRHRTEEPGAWVLQRRVPGQDGVVMHVRPDPGTSPDQVRAFVASLREKISRLD